MNRLARILFIALAPITLPTYALWLGLMTLVSGSYYITVELTFGPLLGRPITFSRTTFWLLSPVFVLLMPLAVAAQSVVWTIRQLIFLCDSVGRWQSGERARVLTVAFGAFWVLAAGWSLVTCIDPQAGFWLLGKNVPGSREFEQAEQGRWTLAKLPPDAQARRREVIESFTTGVNSSLSNAAMFRDDLLHDETLFAQLRHIVQRRILNMPWHFQPYLVSADGISHSSMFAGCLLLSIMLLVRWPGMNRLPAPIATALFAIRTITVVSTVHHVLTWNALEFTPQQFDEASLANKFLFPATWFGVSPFTLTPPFSVEWIPLNVGLWLVLIGLAVLVWTIARAIAPILGPPGHYTAFLAVRLLQRKRIAFFSIGAVTLCVAMELIVISVMDGFLDTIRARSHTLLGDLIMDAGQGGFPFYEEFAAELRAMPEVEVVTPVIHSYGIVTFADTRRVKAVEVRGIRLDEYRKVTGFGRPGVLFYEQYYPGLTNFAPASQPSWGVDPKTDLPVLPEPFESAWNNLLNSKPEPERTALLNRWGRHAGDVITGPGIFKLSEDLKPAMKGPPLPGAIIGRDIIASRMPSGDYERSENYPRGTVCQLSLLSINRSGKLDSQPIAPAYRYVDDSRTGVYEIDSRTVYVDFADLQDKLYMSPQQRADDSGKTPARANSMQIKLRPGESHNEMKKIVAAAWMAFSTSREADELDRLAMRNVDVLTWEEMQQDFISAIQKEKVLTVIMFGIISVVAVLLVLCIFYMIVVEKTRDIGIIKSVGGSANGVAAVFLTYGAAIGVVGAALGSVLGTLFVRHINAVQDWLARLNPEWRVWSPQSYSFDQIPDVVKTSHIVWIAGFAILAAIIGAVGPAIRAAKTWPVEALRYE